MVIGRVIIKYFQSDNIGRLVSFNSMYNLIVDKFLIRGLIMNETIRKWFKNRMEKILNKINKRKAELKNNAGYRQYERDNRIDELNKLDNWIRENFK